MLLITRMSQYNCLLAASFQLNVYPSVTHTFFLDTKIKNVYMQAAADRLHCHDKDLQVAAQMLHRVSACIFNIISCFCCSFFRPFFASSLGRDGILLI